MVQSLDQLRHNIRKEVPFVDLKQDSRNLISLNLSLIAKRYGYDEVNRCIDKNHLVTFGWRKLGNRRKVMEVNEK